MNMKDKTEILDNKVFLMNVESIYSILVSENLALVGNSPISNKLTFGTQALIGQS